MDGHERWEHAFSGKSRPDNPRRPYLSLSLSLSFLLFTAADRPKRNADCVHFLRCAFTTLCGGLAGRAVVCCRKAPEFFFPLTAAMRGGKRTQWTVDG